MHQLDIIVSVSGSNLLQSFKEVCVLHCVIFYCRGYVKLKCFTEFCGNRFLLFVERFLLLCHIVLISSKHVVC